jgi:inhibitor of cysteine peptidase
MKTRETFETVRVHQGQLFSVTLASNPTTGYSWSDHHTAGLAVVNTQYVSPQHQPGLIGAGGRQVWQLMVVQPAPQRFVAEYSRPWEGEVAERYVLDVQILN